jgi:hypothetical protein
MLHSIFAVVVTKIPWASMGVEVFNDLKDFFIILGH